MRRQPREIRQRSPRPRLGREDAGQGENQKRGVKQDMGQIAIGQQMHPGPDGKGPHQGVTGQPDNAGAGRVEPLGMATEGEGVLRPDRKDRQQDRQRHGDIGQPALPRGLRPDLDIGRPPRRHQQPVEQPERQDTEPGDIAAATETPDQRCLQSGPHGDDMGSQKQREGQCKLAPPRHLRLRLEITPNA